MSRLARITEAGRRAASGALSELWKRLPLSQSLRYKVQFHVPSITNGFSTHYQPAPTYERPPARARIATERADGRAIGYVAPRARTRPEGHGARLVVAYVGMGSEAWAQVTRARPQFDGHAQPRLPGELGYYDENDAEILPRQAALAWEVGIDAFAFRDAPAAVERYLSMPDLPLSFCVIFSADTEHGRALLARAKQDPRYLHDLEIPPRAAEPTQTITARQALLNRGYRGEVYDWRTHPPSSRCVDAGRDDEPMQPGRGRICLHASPRGYGQWLQRSLVEAGERGVVFVEAWNDWCRGAVLEPDVRLGHAYLEATRAAVVAARRGRKPLAKPCAVVHVYYVELLDEIAKALKGCGVDLRVIVTTPTDKVALVRDRLRALGLVAEIEPHENRGRDILPFLRVANRLLDEGVEVVVKLHTKSSGHRADGDTWRAELIGRLLDAGRASRILAAFGKDEHLGCVAPEGHVLPLSVYWGWNEETVRYLCVRMGIPDPNVVGNRFAAGSMFWARLSALRPLLDAHLDEWEFEPEGGYIDGTMAHGIERALSLAVGSGGHRLETAATVCGLPFSDDAAYAYAEASHPPP